MFRFRVVLGIVFVSILVSASAQDPGAEVSLELAVVGDRATFRIGEEIPIELRFRSDAPGRYQVAINTEHRGIRVPTYDRFFVEPDAGTAYPLANNPYGVLGMAQNVFEREIAGPESVVAVSYFLNERIAFEAPGRYQVVVESARVREGEPLRRTPYFTLRSNPIEVTIVDPEPGWAAEQVRISVSAIEGFTAMPAAQRAGHDAARRLSFIREATLELARLYDRYPFTNDLAAGLYASPFPEDALAVMEARLDAPDLAVSRELLNFLGTYTGSVATAPHSADWTETDLAEWSAATQSAVYGYYERLGAALESKQGEALAVSLSTLSDMRLPDGNPPSAIRAVLGRFDLLSPVDQERILGWGWNSMGAPEIEPIVRRAAAEGSGVVRDTAWMRLLEFDPDAAREVAIDRILRGDLTLESEPLLIRLPDTLLPELDEALASGLEDGLPVALLTARFASEAIYPRVRAVFGNQTAACSPLIAYFARVDPEFADEALARVRSGNTPCPLDTSSRVMSPALERMAIRDLDDANETVRMAGLELLRRAGSEAVKQALFDHLVRLAASPVENVVARTTSTVYTLLHGNGWVLSNAEFDRLAAICGDVEQCRNLVSSGRRMLEARPVRLGIRDYVNLGFGATSTQPPEIGFFLGPWEDLTFAQLSERLALFEPGTVFEQRVPTGFTWHQSYYATRIEQQIADAGMELVDVR